jgi:hypothetical protein
VGGRKRENMGVNVNVDVRGGEGLTRCAASGTSRGLPICKCGRTEQERPAKGSAAAKGEG